MAMILKGAEVVAELAREMTESVEALHVSGVEPTLSIVRIGERESDLAYELSAVKRCESIGVSALRHVLNRGVSEEEVLRLLQQLSADEAVHGILLLRPLPAYMDEDRIRAAIAPEKDVDGITDASLAGVFTGSGLGYAPCTAEACMEILKHYEIPCAGKKAVIIGRSLVVGKPLSMLLLKENATVTICHTGTIDLPAEARRADILISAMGRGGFLTADYFSPGQTIVDVGVSFTADGRLVGDVKFDEAEPIVSAITPAPGGVGAVTSSVLVRHVIHAATKRNLGA